MKEIFLALLLGATICFVGMVILVDYGYDLQGYVIRNQIQLHNYLHGGGAKKGLEKFYQDHKMLPPKLNSPNKKPVHPCFDRNYKIDC